MARFIVSFIVSFLLLFSAPGGFAQAAPDAPRIQTQLEIVDGSRIVGQPRVIAPAGEAVTVVKEGPDGYALRTNTVETATRTGFVTVSAELWLARDKVWKKAATPGLTVKKGSVASIVITARSRADGQQQDDLKIKVMASDVLQTSSSDDDTLSRVLASSGCPGWSEEKWQSFLADPVPDLLPAQATTLPGPGDGNCCSTGCLTCCGESACCTDPTNCLGGCCTG